jgi:hypothetical protein
MQFACKTMKTDTVRGLCPSARIPPAGCTEALRSDRGSGTGSQVMIGETSGNSNISFRSPTCARSVREAYVVATVHSATRLRLGRQRPAAAFSLRKMSLRKMSLRKMSMYRQPGTEAARLRPETRVESRRYRTHAEAADRRLQGCFRDTCKISTSGDASSAKSSGFGSSGGGWPPVPV